MIAAHFRAVPGVDWEGNFDAGVFGMWLEKVKAWSRENDRYEVAMHLAGQGISHAPKSEEFLVYEPLLEALNEADAEELRRGYIIGVLNQQGARFVDTSGSKDKARAEKYRAAADKALEMGYSRYSHVLGRIADSYDRESQELRKRASALKRPESDE